MPNLELKRELGLFETTLYGVGLILGAGIYTVIGEAAGFTGNSLPFAFLISALIAAFTGLTYAELSTMFPESGAEYVYTFKAFGSHPLSTIIAVLRIFVGVIGASAVSLAFSGYLMPLLPENFLSLFPIPMITIAVLLIAVLSLINFYGIKLSASMNIIFTLVEVGGLIIIIALGIMNWHYIDITQLPHQAKGLFNSAFLVFFAYIGFQSIVNITEETKNPEDTVPNALILSIVITTGLYFLVALCSLVLANWQELAASSAPLAYAAAQALGPKAFFIMSVIALFSTTNTVLISLISTSRMLYGSSKKRYAFPSFLSKVHHATKTPYAAVFAVMLIGISFVLIGDISIVANLTNLGLLTIFIFVNLSLIRIRLKKPQIKGRFRSPLNYKNFPITALLGFLTSLVFVSFYILRNFIP